MMATPPEPDDLAWRAWTRPGVQGRGPKKPRRSGVAHFGLSLLLSALLVFFLLRDVGFDRIVETLASTPLSGVGLGTLAFAIMIAARAVRYRLLLSQRVEMLPLTLITMVRGMFADLLPARLGTLSYVWLVRKRVGVPLDDAFASFLLAFVFDMVAIAPLLLLALLVVSVGLDVGLGVAALASILLGGSIVAILLMAPALRIVAGLLLRSGPATGGLVGLAGRVGGTLGATADRVDEVRRRGALVPVFLISLLVRLSKFGAYYYFLQAVLVPLGVAWGTVGFFESFLGVAGAEMSAMLPISGIAAFGTWEAAFALGFTRLGLSSEQAVVSGFATHILSQLHDYGLGVIALIVLMWPGRRWTRQRGSGAAAIGRAHW